MISVRAIDERAELDGLAPEWDRLFNLQARPTPFLHRAWFEAFWSEMDHSPGWPLILAAFENSQLVGLAPLTAGKTRRGGLNHWSVFGLENVHSQDYAWLLEPDREEEILEAMVDELERLFTGRVMISWGNAYMDHPASASAARVLSRRGRRVDQRVRRHAPVVRFPGGGKSFFSTLGTKTRKRLNRNLRLLDQEGRVRLEEVSASADLQSHLDAAWELEAGTWKGRLGTAVGLDPRLTGFYNRLAVNMAARDMLCLFVLYLDDNLIAFDFNLHAGDTVHILKTSFDDAWAKLSPNRLVVRALIDWAEERGLTALSMGGDADEWKMRWTDETDEVTWLYAFPPGPAGWWLYTTRFGWKETLKRVPGLTTAKSAADRRRQAARRQG